MLRLIVKFRIFLFILGGSLFLVASFFLISPLRTETANNEISYHYSNPSDIEFFETTYQFRGDEIDLSDLDVFSGIIPHHLLAGDLIANFFSNLEGKDYDLIVLIGPNHFSSGKSEAISSVYNWETPYGVLESDKGVIRALERDGLLVIENEAMIGEHSMNSEVSYIKKTFPNAKLVPIILKHSYTKDEASYLANYLDKLGKNKKILMLASCDFSHYKSSKQAQYPNI
jgi:AmmeMemoRadiSam system protein B